MNRFVFFFSPSSSLPFKASSDERARQDGVGGLMNVLALCCWHCAKRRERHGGVREHTTAINFSCLCPLVLNFVTGIIIQHARHGVMAYHKL